MKKSHEVDAHEVDAHEIITEHSGWAGSLIGRREISIEVRKLLTLEEIAAVITYGEENEFISIAFPTPEEGFGAVEKINSEVCDIGQNQMAWNNPST